MERLDEQTLSQRFSTGGEELLSVAIEHYGQPLLRYCHHILCDYHEAQDAVQTTFLKAYDNRARFQPGTCLRAWLYRLAYTTCIDLMRAQRREQFAPPPQAGNPDYIGPALRQALSCLSAEDRALVFGRVMEARSYEELSEIHGRSPATLRKRYERARKKLAQALTEQRVREEATI